MLKLVVSNPLPPVATEVDGDMSDTVKCLHEEAEHLERLAEIWSDGPCAADFEQISDNYRRQARRIRDTANAIERDQQAGPFEPLPSLETVPSNEWLPF